MTIDTNSLKLRSYLSICFFENQGKIIWIKIQTKYLKVGKGSKLEESEKIEGICNKRPMGEKSAFNHLLGVPTSNH